MPLDILVNAKDVHAIPFAWPALHIKTITSHNGVQANHKLHYRCMHLPTEGQSERNGSVILLLFVYSMEPIGPGAIKETIGALKFH